MKVKEKMPVYDYKVPEEYHQVEKGTEKAICISVIDQMLSDAFGIHILEPTVTFKAEEVIRPNLTKAAAKKIQRASESSEKGQVNVVGLIEKVEARRANEPSSRQTNRSNLPKIGRDTRQSEQRPMKPIDVEGIKEMKKTTTPSELPSSYH